MDAMDWERKRVARKRPASLLCEREPLTTEALFLGRAARRRRRRRLQGESGRDERDLIGLACVWWSAITWPPRERASRRRRRRSARLASPRGASCATRPPVGVFLLLLLLFEWPSCMGASAARALASHLRPADDSAGGLLSIKSIIGAARAILIMKSRKGEGAPIDCVTIGQLRAASRPS